MYWCRPGLLMRGICWGVLVFCLLELGFCAWLVFEPSMGLELRFCAGFGAVLFGGLALALLRRLLYLGYAWLEYDDRRLVLHFSRREELALTWTDLGEVVVGENGRSLLFSDGASRRRLVVTPMFEGWRDLRDELKQRGLLPPDIDPQELMDKLFGPVDRSSPDFKVFERWK